MSIGTLLAIAGKASKRADMVTAHETEITLENGVAGDWRGRPGPRQVTIVSQESWRDACNELGQQVDWIERRANLLVDTVDLRSADGEIVRVGDAVLRVTGELEPCSRMDEACMGLQKALQPEWRGGVTCQVIRGGRIRIGDPVEIVSDSQD